MVLKVALGVLIGRFVYDCLFYDFTDVLRYKLQEAISKKLKEVKKENTADESKLTIYNKTNIGFKM